MSFGLIKQLIENVRKWHIFGSESANFMSINAEKDCMYPASLIAYAFVEMGIKERNYVTQMKLQKMVYFAQGVHLAVYGVPLIAEDFEAWKFGPVVREIYNQYKLFGSDPIRETTWILRAFERNQDLNTLDTNAKKTIRYTWDTTKDLSAGALSNWTHKKDSPWDKFYNDMTTGSVIDKNEIKEYFKKLLFKTS